MVEHERELLVCSVWCMRERILAQSAAAGILVVHGHGVLRELRSTWRSHLHAYGTCDPG
jgi:hypothetical protein